MSTTIARAAAHHELHVEHLDLPSAARRRLAELGVRPGSRLIVLGRTAGGGRVVAVGTSRIALDARTARLVTVNAAA